MPAPVNPITIGDPGALLTTEMLPVALPAAAGKNFAVKDAVCPAANVAGRERPAMENPVPDAVACETVTLAVPEFVRVTVADPLLPSNTLPKLMLDGFAVRAPCTPVPLTGMETVASVAVLVIDMVPVELPVAAGENCAVKLVD